MRAKGNLVGVITGLLLAFVGVAGMVSPASGQGAIEVLQDEVTVRYPFSVNFDLMAVSSAAPISSVRIFWQAGPEDAFHVQSLNVRRSYTVSAQFPLSAQFLSLPPFARISYRWQIRDASGNELTTEDRTFEYEDSRHDWQERANKRLRMLWYDLGPAFAESLFTLADSAYLRLADYFGVTLDEPPVVVIYSDRQSFAEFQGLLNNVEFVIGRYFPGHNITVNLVTPDMPPDVYEATIAHELSHLYSDNYYVGVARLPLWLEEGLATFNEALHREDDLAMVRQAAARGNLVPFIDLPAAIRAANIHVANLAYAEGATVFLFIQETYGADILAQFLEAFRQTTSLDNVTRELFGQTVAEFELSWRAWLGYPVESVPQLQPTPTLMPFSFPTPTFAAPGG